MYRQKSNWRKISEPPTKDLDYIVHIPTMDVDKPFIVIAWYNPETNTWSGLPQVLLDGITHWMHKPFPPKLDD